VLNTYVCVCMFFFSSDISPYLPPVVYNNAILKKNEKKKMKEQSKMLVGRQRPITKRLMDAPSNYLGLSEKNVFEPICVYWTGVDDWTPNCGALWWSPSAMQLRNVKTVSHRFEALNSPLASLVPLEHVMVSQPIYIKPPPLCSFPTMF
jgi:hypothetical protein